MLQANGELIRLIAQDEMIKECVLKVGQCHVAIARNDFNKVKKTIRTLGMLDYKMNWFYAKCEMGTNRKSPVLQIG